MRATPNQVFLTGVFASGLCTATKQRESSLVDYDKITTSLNDDKFRLCERIKDDCSQF